MSAKQKWPLATQPRPPRRYGELSPNSLALRALGYDIRSTRYMERPAIMDTPEQVSKVVTEQMETYGYTTATLAGELGVPEGVARSLRDRGVAPLPVARRAMRLLNVHAVSLPSPKLMTGGSE